MADRSSSTYRKGGAFFLDQIRRRKLVFAFIVLLTFGYSSLVTLGILFLGLIVDAFVSPSTVTIFGLEFQSWMLFFGLFIAASLGQYGFSLTKDRLEVVVGSRIKQHYLSTRFSHLLRLPMHFLRDKKKGELIGVTEEFASSFDRGLKDLLGLLELGVRLAVFVVTIFITINYIIGLVYLSATLLTFYLSFVMSRRYRAAVGRRVDQVTEAKGQSYDVVNNYDIVKNFNKERAEASNLSRIYGKLRFFELKENATYLRFNGFNIFIFQLFIFFNMGLGLFLLDQDTISVGDVVNLYIYSGFMFGLIVVGAERYINFTGFLFGVGKSEEIYYLEEEQYGGADKLTPTAFKGEVEFQNVWFTYPDGKDEVLRGVSFTIKSGERVALTGPSGVGKTTIVNLALGFYFPTKGEVLVDGVSTRRLDLNYLRQNISTVSQDVSLFNASIGDNVRYGANSEVTDEAVAASCKQAEMHDFIMNLPEQYDQLVGERGIQLSGGQRQRVAIARAFVRDSKFIILDEPTSSLDSDTEVKIQKSLRQLLVGRTSITIAHRLSTVRASDKILVFSRGKLIGEGKHDDLIVSNEMYKKLYEIQSTLTSLEEAEK